MYKGPSAIASSSVCVAWSPFPLTTFTMQVRLLALHGKGTNATIFKAQVGPILKATGIEDCVNFESAPHDSVPYHNIERYFPGQTYHSWYESPNPVSLQLAYEYVEALMSGEKQVRFVSKDMSPCRPRASTASSSVTRSKLPISALKPLQARLLKMPSLCISSGSSCSTNAVEMSPPGALSPFGASLQQDSSDGTLSPAVDGIDASPLSYDGIICFSQGCAVSAGSLLQQALRNQKPLIRFAIFICESCVREERLATSSALAALQILTDSHDRTQVALAHLIRSRQSAMRSLISKAPMDNTRASRSRLCI